MSERLSNAVNIDLHCHLDGSLQIAFVQQVLQEIQGKPWTQGDILKQMQAPPDCTDLTRYLGCFDLPVTCMQTKQHIVEGSRSFVQSLVADDVAYAEARFSPVLFANKDLGQREALEAVLNGLAQGAKETGIVVNAIICGLRHFEAGVNEAAFALARDYLGQGVCAVDLAGDESALPNHHFADLFALAKKLELPFTIHAGECGDANSIADAISFGAKRIGHGIAMAGNPEVQELCKRENITVEMCPTSNFQTKAAKSHQDYPLLEFLKAGVPVTINTDNRTVSNTALKKEYALIRSVYALSDTEEQTLRRNAIEGTFASDDVKQALWKKMQVV